MSDPAIYAASWLVNPGVPPIPGGAILVRNGIIDATGTLAELKKTYPVPIFDHPGCAILPGLVNAHTHLELTHFPAWRLRTHMDYNPRRFVDWIIQLIKIKQGLTVHDFETSICEGIRLCLESGTTAAGEILADLRMLPMYRSSGFFGRIFFELLGQDPVKFNSLLGPAITACQADSGEGFAAGLSPHTPYTINENFLPLVREAAMSRSLPLSIHISESPAESDFIFDSSGPLADVFYPFLGWQAYLMPPHRCSSTQLLDRAGLLTAATLAVHCVHVTRADAEILRQRGVKVVLCPRSNDRLDVGRAPVALLKKLEVPLALGTDSLASNDTLSLWDEMRFALSTFPHDLSPAEVFRMTTSAGADALGISSQCGSLETGKRADFQIIENIDSSGADVLERVIFVGVVRDVYATGAKYVGIGPEASL